MFFSAILSAELGLLDRYCAHRRVSLEFGRVEAAAFAAAIHGWHYGTDGSCADTAARAGRQPARSDGVKLAGYAVTEAGGLIFAYLGPSRTGFPRWDLLFREAGLTVVGADEEYCNWLQRAENTVDQHHLCSLHAAVYPQLAFKRSEVDWEPTWYGLKMIMHVPGLAAPKVDHFVFPSSNRFTRARVGVPPSHNLRIRVPTDDEKTTTFWVKIYPSITDQGRLRTEGLKPRQRGVYDRGPMAGGTSLRTSRTASRRKAKASSPTARSRRSAGPIAASSFFARCCMRARHGRRRRDPPGVLRDDRNIIDLSASMDELDALAPA